MKPWLGMNPNSRHQLWSEWTFTIYENGKYPLFKEVEYNLTKWISQGFGSVGRMKLNENLTDWVAVVQIEGIPANDPSFVEKVRTKFQTTFVEKGWGPLSTSKVDVKILAGDPGNGQAPSQLIVL